MYYLLSIAAGILISVMVMFNGQLSDHYGVYTATAIIHLIGLIFTSILLVVKKEPVRRLHKIPFYYFAGGLVGILTVLFNNLSFGKISVSAILAICLLGQSITSLVFDQFGFFNMPKSKFHKSKLIGISIVLLGIIVMVSFYEISALIPIILSLLTGFTVVLSRTINAGLAEKTSVLQSTLYCYITGFTGSVVLLFTLGGGMQALSGISFSANAMIYSGGVMGVIIISFLNATVSKISSFYMTLLLFAGQVFSAILVDLFLTQVFSFPNFLGGVFVVLGLSVNVWLDKKRKLKDALTERTIEN